MREQEASEELIDHEQEDPLKDENVFTLINTSVVYTSITSSSRPNVAALYWDDNKKINEELQHVNIPIVPLSPYSFVH